jgi:monoamine oxidase
MTALELARAGKDTLILEARERIGGRIWPLPIEALGYPAQGGAEFVHGDASVTTALLRQAGLTLLPLDGEVWSLRGQHLTKRVGGPTHDPALLAHKDRLHDTLLALPEDISIAQFLERYFKEDQYLELREWVRKMVEGYDAADPCRASTFALREGWLNGEEWQQSRIKEGYGALLTFLESECRKHEVEIRLNQDVKTIHADLGGIHVGCMGGDECEAQKIVVTVPLPTLTRLRFTPALPEKMTAASQIGVGQVMKFLLRFKDAWWRQARGQDLSKMMFFLCHETIPTWWTQYPDSSPVLTGWLPGAGTEEFKHRSANAMLGLAMTSLADTFKVHEDFLYSQLRGSKIINWPADPFAQGAYSYRTLDAEAARRELTHPVQNQIFFAGEALASGRDTATVEGALASGKETAERILNGSR